MSAKTIKSSLTNPREILRITTRDDVVSMKDIPNGTEINMTAFVVQEVTKDRGADANGEVFKTILVRDDQGVIYATRSETFQNKLDDIMQLLNDSGMPVDLENEPLVLRITHQKSRSGNTFVSCALA